MISSGGKYAWLYFCGQESFASSKPIAGLEDLKGWKIRFLPFIGIQIIVLILVLLMTEITMFFKP